jgi:hypothetical protein
MLVGILNTSGFGQSSAEFNRDPQGDDFATTTLSNHNQLTVFLVVRDSCILRAESHKPKRSAMFSARSSQTKYLVTKSVHHHAVVMDALTWGEKRINAECPGNIKSRKSTGQSLYARPWLIFRRDGPTQCGSWPRRKD